MAFKARIHPCSIEDDGEKLSFFVKEPSGRTILEQASKAKAREDAGQAAPSATENAREAFKSYIVHEDGSALSDAEVEEMLDMRFSAVQKVQEVVFDRTGLSRSAKKG